MDKKDLVKRIGEGFSIEQNGKTLFYGELVLECNLNDNIALALYNSSNSKMIERVGLPKDSELIGNRFLVDDSYQLNLISDLVNTRNYKTSEGLLKTSTVIRQQSN